MPAAQFGEQKGRGDVARIAALTEWAEATMDTWDAIRSRRNVREFEERPVASEDLDRILEAGRRAPSARNWQPWDFILVTERETLADLAGVWRGAWHVANAPAAIALIAPIVQDETRRDLLQYDLGHATMAIMLAAADVGIGTGHASVQDQIRSWRAGSSAFPRTPSALT
jgi:nitroreductase